MSKNILILGGSGNAGIKIADLLLKNTGISITLAARNEKKLEIVTHQLNEQYSNDRVSYVYADASDKDSLLRAFEGNDMVVVASGTAKYVEIVASVALNTEVDYLDIHYSTKKMKILKSMEADIKNKGKCFITEAGFHPGLPAALVRFGALQFDEIHTALIGSVIRQDWNSMDVSPSTAMEFVQELTDFQSVFYKDGEWRRANMVSTKDFIEMEFMEPYGKQLCAPMFFEEMLEISETYPSLTHTGFYIAGFSKFIDMVIMPFVFMMLKIAPQLALNPMAKLMYWSLGTFSKPPFATIVKLEASGVKDSEPKEIELQLSHEDGYWFTAIPVVACLLQYLDGYIRKPGLWTMGNLVEPTRLMNDMKRMGIMVSEAIIIE